MSMEQELNPALPAESVHEVDEVMGLMQALDEKGRRSMLDFIRGAKFMQSAMLDGQAPSKALRIPENGSGGAACPAQGAGPS